MINRKEFTLDTRLESDTFLIGEMPLCKVLLMNVSNFPWIILVPRVPEINELFQLDKTEKVNYQSETNYLLEQMSKLYKAHKMNIASLGNLVPQLHTHIIARYRTDDAWPNPVWSYPEITPYESHHSELEIDKIKKLVDDYR